MRLIIPMMIGMICAMGVGGTLVGVLLGFREWQHTLFFHRYSSVSWRDR